MRFASQLNEVQNGQCESTSWSSSVYDCATMTTGSRFLSVTNDELVARSYRKGAKHWQPNIAWA